MFRHRLAAAAATVALAFTGTGVALASTASASPAACTYGGSPVCATNHLDPYGGPVAPFGYAQAAIDDISWYAAAQFAASWHAAGHVDPYVKVVNPIPSSSTIPSRALWNVTAAHATGGVFVVTVGTPTQPIAFGYPGGGSLKGYEQEGVFTASFVISPTSRLTHWTIDINHGEWVLTGVGDSGVAQAAAFYMAHIPASSWAGD